MIERKARVYASRARSSSLREVKSAESLTIIGLGVGLRLGSSKSSSAETDSRFKMGTGDGAGMVSDTSSTGKKLLLLDARGAGEEDGTRNLLGEARGGVGGAFPGLGVSFPCSGVDKAT